MSNQTYSDLLSKSANAGILEQVNDVDLIGLHQICKSDMSGANSLVSRNKHSWLPLIEKEIIFRKEVLLKSEESEELEKGGRGSGRHKGATTTRVDTLTEKLLDQASKHKDGDEVSPGKAKKFLKQFLESNDHLEDSEINLEDFWEWYDH